MNKLEREIEEYIISTNIEQMTAKEVADKFFVSRTYLYKIIKKMGYSSYTDLKFEKRMKNLNENFNKDDKPVLNSNVIKEMNLDMFSAGIIYVIGFEGAGLVADFFTRQLMNLNQLVICINDTSIVIKYLSHIKTSDTVIYFSNTGRSQELHDKLQSTTNKLYVITKYKSMLYLAADKKIGFDNEVDNLSNKYDQEDISMLLMLAHTLLAKFKNYIVTNTEE